MVSTAGRRNPFSAQGVSQYPPPAPLVGQPRVFDAVQELIADLREDEGASFCVVYGDWGIGKSRLAHELVAEVTGKSAGWLVDNDAPQTLLQPLAAGGVLPIFTTLLDVVKADPQDLYRGESLAKCARVALRGLCSARGQDLWVAMARDLQQAVGALGEVDWAELGYLLESPDADPVQGLLALHEATKGAVKRLLIIVDEVETPHEIASAATPEQRARDWPLDETTIRVLFTDMKEAAGQQALPGIAFIFLCSPGVRAAAGTLPALQRRLREATLTRATGDDLERLMQELDRAGYRAPYPGRLLEAAFLAADRNFGWFSYLMNPIFRELTAGGAERRRDYDVLATVAGRVGKIFRPALVEERPLQPSVKTALRRLAYHQLPATAEELEVDEADLLTLLTEKDPYGDPLAAEVETAHLSADALIRGLLEHGYEPESAHSTNLVGEGSTPFEPSDLLARFATFRADAGAIWYYHDHTEFTKQFNLLTADSPAEFSDQTRSTVLNILRGHTITGAARIAPSMSLLLRFNERWAVANQGTWLNAEAWRRTDDKVQALPPAERHRRLCLGAAYMALRTTGQLDPTALASGTSPVLRFGLAPGDPLALSPSRMLTVAYNHDPHELRENLSHLPDLSRGAVLVIHADTIRRDRFRSLVSGETNAELTACMVDRVIEPGSREFEFYVRYAFLGETFQPDDVRPRGRVQRDEYERLWQAEIALWKVRLEKAGLLLRPIAATAAMANFRLAYAALMRGQARETLAELPSGKALHSAFEAVIAQARGGGTLLVIDEAGQPIVPPLFGRLLALATVRQPLDALAKRFLYDRGARADVSFPENPQIVLRQVLQLLAELDLVDETADGWQTVTGAFLAEELAVARRRLGTASGTGGMIAIAAGLPPGYRPLAERLLVDATRLQGLAQRMDHTIERSGRSDPLRVIASGLAVTERSSLLEQLSRFRDLARSSGDPSSTEETTPVVADDPELEEDTNYRTYTVSARLRYIAAQVRQESQAQQQRTAEREATHAAITALAKTASGVHFPIQPALTALQQPNAKGQEVVARATTIRNSFDALVQRERTSESRWEATLGYFDEASDIDQFLPRDTVGRCADVRERIIAFGTALDGRTPAATLDDLEHAIKTLTTDFTAADTALATAREAAEKDVARRITDLPVAAVRRAAQRASRQEVIALLDEGSIWNAPTRREQLGAVAALGQRATEAGKALCGADINVFHEYLTLHGLLSAGRAEEAGARYRDQRGVLDRLAGLGLIQWTVHIDV